MYPPAPPVTATVAVPFEPPLQETFVCADALATNTVGCVIVKDCVAEQPLASVTVTV